MELFSNFNTLDLLLIFLLFIGALVGFMRGMGPQLMSLASFWLAMLAALWVYTVLSVNIFQESEIFGKTTSDTLSFMILFVVFFNAIRLMIKYLTKPPEEKKKKPKRKGQVGPAEEKPPTFTQRFIVGPLLALGSMVLGVLLMALWLAVLLGVAQFFLNINVAEAGGGAGRGLANQITSSTLVPYFNRLLWILVQSVDLFVLDEKADILKKVVCQIYPGGVC